MDSLLSHAQRCVRKADSFLSCGLYDESLMELEKSIEYLNELKSSTICFESMHVLNAQLEAIDRKMRSVAIRRTESLKKKSQIENLINKTRRRESSTSSSPSLSLTSNQTTKSSNKSQTDEAAEYKRVNSFLVDEIENLKRENEYLRGELLKMYSNSRSASIQSVLNISQGSLRSSSSAISESSTSLMMCVSTTATSKLTESSTNVSVTVPSLGIVPQQQSNKQNQPKSSTPMPISSLLLDEDKDHEYENFSNGNHLDHPVNGQRHPIDLSRYLNEEEENDDNHVDASSAIYTTNTNLDCYGYTTTKQTSQGTSRNHPQLLDDKHKDLR